MLPYCSLVGVKNATMRTTVTIDTDTEHLLREQTIRAGHSFKKVLNQSIRRALSQPSSQRLEVQPLFVAPF